MDQLRGADEIGEIRGQGAILLFANGYQNFLAALNQGAGTDLIQTVIHFKNFALVLAFQNTDIENLIGLRLRTEGYLALLFDVDDQSAGGGGIITNLGGWAEVLIIFARAGAPHKIAAIPTARIMKEEISFRFIKGFFVLEWKSPEKRRRHESCNLITTAFLRRKTC